MHSCGITTSQNEHGVVASVLHVRIRDPVHSGATEVWAS